MVFSVVVLCIFCCSAYSFKLSGVKTLFKFRYHKSFETHTSVFTNPQASGSQLQLTSSPFLSLDKIVIPQHDRAMIFKIGLICIAWSITTFLFSAIKGQKNVLSAVLSAVIEKIRDFQFKSDTRTQTADIDLKTWQSIPLSKIKDLNEDYAMLQFDLPNKSLFDFGIDIGQEVSLMTIEFVV